VLGFISRDSANPGSYQLRSSGQIKSCSFIRSKALVINVEDWKLTVALQIGNGMQVLPPELLALPLLLDIVRLRSSKRT
jgi:hypothetical protein